MRLFLTILCFFSASFFTFSSDDLTPCEQQVNIDSSWISLEANDLLYGDVDLTGYIIKYDIKDLETLEPVTVTAVVRGIHGVNKTALLEREEVDKRGDKRSIQYFADRIYFNAFTINLKRSALPVRSDSSKSVLLEPLGTSDRTAGEELWLSLRVDDIFYGEEAKIKGHRIKFEEPISFFTTDVSEVKSITKTAFVRGLFGEGIDRKVFLDVEKVDKNTGAVTYIEVSYTPRAFRILLFSFVSELQIASSKM